jgi:long-subunit fatty acid transport protein
MKLVVSLFALTLALISHVNAQERIEIPSSFNPVGSGARAMGMGGSFISIADDATAASWNPAGLIQLRKPEVAVVFSATELNEDLDFSLASEASGEQSSSSTDLNYFAVSVPCSSNTCGKNMVFSLNYQRLFDLTREWDFTLNRQSDLLDLEQDYQHQQTGALYALGAAYAVQLTDNFTVGLTLNFWDSYQSSNDWTNRYNIEGEGTITDIEVQEVSTFYDDYDFEGFNYNLGFVWNVYQKGKQKWVLGAVYKSEFDADITKSSSTMTQQTFPDFPDSSFSDSTGPIVENQEITFPSSIGVGAAFQWDDYVTVSLDVYRTDWSSFVLTAEDGSSISPISGRSSAEVTVADTTQIRMGVEYRIISQDAGKNYIIPLRAGLFRDPIAADENAENAYGLSLGTGIAYETCVFDIAYQYRWANDVGTSYLSGLGFSQDINEHQLFGSMFYRF